MIVYDVVTKVLDTEPFPQHNTAGLISGITFTVSFSQEKPYGGKYVPNKKVINLFHPKDKACKIAPNCPLVVNDQDSGVGSAGLTITAQITIWDKTSVVFYCPKLTTDLIFVIQEEFSILFSCKA